METNHSHTQPAASTAKHSSPQSGITGVERGAAPATLPIDATRKSSPVGKRAETPTGEAGAPNLSTLPPLPICGSCGRNPYSCVCNAPDGTEDMTPAEDVNRIMREWRELREAREMGWQLAERSALGMTGGKL